MVSRLVILSLGVMAVASTSWAIGVEGGGLKPAPTTTVTFQPVLWEPYIPELYVKPVGGAEGHAKSVLTMEKPQGELPGIRPAWRGLKQRFRLDDVLGREYGSSDEILSGWTRSQTGFLVHASAQATPSGDAKLVQQMIAEAPALLHVAVGIDWGGKVAEDKERYLFDTFFKALELKIAAYEIPQRGTEFNPEDIRGLAGREPFLLPLNMRYEFGRRWTAIVGNLTSTGMHDADLPPWRVGKAVEIRLEGEVEGRLDETEEAVRKKLLGAIRFVVLPPKGIDIRKLSGESKKEEPKQ
jgi:hypothetical protein